MKILIITASLGCGGAERVVAQLANEWVATGNEVTVLLVRENEVFYWVDPDVRIRFLETKKKKTISSKLAWMRGVRRFVSRSRPDVVLSLPEEIGIYVALALVGKPTKLVVSERNNPYVMPYKKITRLLRRLAYRFVDGFIFQSEAAAGFFPKAIRRRSVVLDNPLDLSRIPPRFEGERDKRIVSVSRLEKQKNIRLLLDGFALFSERHPDYRLEIYGDGNLRGELEEYAKTLKGSDAVCFMGRRDDVLEKIRCASAFVLSSDFEGVPNALIEAMACGVPSVSTDFDPSGASVVIEDGKNGLIVPKNDPAALSAALEKLLDPDLSPSFSENALTIKGRVDAHTVAAKWLDFLGKE